MEHNDDLSPDLAAVPSMVSLRNTEEYRAAWDVEVWKAIQLSHFQKEFLETKRKMRESFQAELKQTESQKLGALDRQARELLTRERRIVEDEKVLERRRLKLQEAEKELLSLRSALADQRKRIEEDAEVRVQRVRDDLAHQAAVFEGKIAHAEAQAKRCEERLLQSQNEYVKLFEEFSAFKTRQISHPESSWVLQLERLHAEHKSELVALQDRLDRRRQEQVLQLSHRNESLEAEVLRLTAALSRKKDALKVVQEQKAAADAALERSQADLLRLRSELATAVSLASQGPQGQQRSSSRRPHDGESEARDDLRRLVDSTAAGDRRLQAAYHTAGAGSLSERKRTATLSSSGAVGSLGGGGGGRSADVGGSRSGKEDITAKHESGGGAEGIFAAEQRRIARELTRLEKERSFLLEHTGGAYAADSEMIAALSRKISQLRQQLVLPPQALQNSS